MTPISKSARSREACGYAAGVAVGRPFSTSRRNQRLLGLLGRHREARHVGAVALGEADLAPLGDQEGVVAGLLHAVLVLPQLAHLGRGLDVVAVAVEAEALRVAHHRPGRHAEQVLVGGGVLAVDVVGVVGRDHRDAEVLAQLEQPVADPLLDGQVVVHQLDEVVVAAEDLLEVAGRLPGLGVVTDPEPGLDLAGRAAGGADQPLGVLGEELAVGARLVVVALHAGAAGEPEEVVHAGRRSRPAGSCGCRHPTRSRRRRRRRSTARASSRSGWCRA